MLYSGMRRRVALLGTDVSDESIESIIRVKRISEISKISNNYLGHSFHSDDVAYMFL
jgi:hypothetical protein